MSFNPNLITSSSTKGSPRKPVKRFTRSPATKGRPSLAEQNEKNESLRNLYNHLSKKSTSKKTRGLPVNRTSSMEAEHGSLTNGLPPPLPPDYSESSSVSSLSWSNSGTENNSSPENHTRSVYGPQRARPGSMITQAGNSPRNLGEQLEEDERVKIRKKLKSALNTMTGETPITRTRTSPRRRINQRPPPLVLDPPPVPPIDYRLTGGKRKSIKRKSIKRKSIKSKSIKKRI